MAPAREGTQCEYAVRNLLAALPGVATAFLLPERHDVGHWDIVVVLDERRTTFFAQVKKLSKSNLRLSSRHLDDWLKSHCLTVLMWWDERLNRCYWADLIRFLFRTGGFRDRKTLSLSFKEDLRHLNAADASSTAQFLDWASGFAKSWPEIQRVPRVLVDEEYPLTLPAAAREPGLVSFLPASSALLKLLREGIGLDEMEIANHVGAVFRAGAQALHSPDDAAALLLATLTSKPIDPSIIQRAAGYLREWAETVRSEERAGVRDALFGFDTAVSLLVPSVSGGYPTPPFQAINTYPFGRVLNLFPVDDVLESLARLLMHERDPTALQYASYALGIMNYPRRSVETVAAIAREARVRLARRKAVIGPSWRVADRQLLYTQAQLGSEEARCEFVRALQDEDSLAFEAAYNWAYYAGNRQVIKRRFEDRLDVGTPSDQHVRDILVRIYDGIRKYRPR